MTALNPSSLTAALALLLTLQGPRLAFARDLPAHHVMALPRAAPGSTLAALASGSAALAAIADPAYVWSAISRQDAGSGPDTRSRQDAVSRQDAGAQKGPAVRGSAPSSGSAGSTEPQLDLELRDDLNADQLCANPQCGTVQQIDLLPELVFEKLEDLPVLGAFVLPVTKGMTIEPGDGLPTLTLALKPGQIRRGSGLVAIAHF
jgi:hypothetical protein